MVKFNPQAQKNGLLLISTAVVGPSMIVAGLRYPGSWRAKGFIALTGLAVSAISYYYFRAKE